MKIVGLTGGIGSGKTTVANFFKAEGVPVYIADEEAKKIMLTEEVRQEIIALLGKEAYNKEVPNRSWIANKVFGNNVLLEKLNSIIHPRVRKHFQQWVNTKNSPYVIYEAAIIFETGSTHNFDYIILVTAPETIRVERVLARDQSTEEAIKARMEKQWPDKKKAQLADFVLQNNTHIEDTKAAVKKLHKDLLMLAKP